MSNNYNLADLHQKSCIPASAGRRDGTISAEIRPLSELNQQATEVLVREMGIVDALRFLNQFSSGSGDYTKDREQWLGNLTLEQITLEIKARKKQRA